MNRFSYASSAFILLFCLLISSGLKAQEDKKILTLDDYDRWSRIVSVELSDDGNWMTYGYRPNKGDDTLFIKNTSDRTVLKKPLGGSPEFSEDSRWVLFFRNTPEKKAEKLRKQKKRVYRKGVLMNLDTRDEFVLDKIQDQRFAPSSDFVIMEKASENKGYRGKDILLKNLEEGWLMNLGNVSEYAFNNRGDLLAYTIDADQKAGNGVYLMKMDDRTITPLYTDSARFHQLTWDDEMLYDSEKGAKGTALAVLKGHKIDSLEQMRNDLVLCTGLDDSTPSVEVMKPGEDFEIPEGYVVSEYGRIRFSLDNERLLLPIKEQEKALKVSKDTLPNVDVWHWKDEQIQSVQMRRANYNRRSTYYGLLHLSNNSFVRLTSDDLRNVQYDRELKALLGSDPKPYISDINWGGSARDYYTIDYRDGTKQLIAKEIARSMGLSPSGEHFLFFKNKHFSVYHMEDDEMIQITESLPVRFFDVEEDHPFENPSYGMAGWTADQKAVVLNHRYDLWQVRLDGSGGENITGNYGTENKIRFRVNRLEYDQPYINLDEEVYLSAYGEWTKKSGYFLLKEGRRPGELVYADHNYSRLMKADDADKMIFTRQTFVDFPDYYLTDGQFRNVAKMTDANPQQEEYRWGRRILVDYENSHGDRLQGTLTLPAGYEEGKKYPMLVYFYEKMSQRHHSYSMPVYDDRPHMSAYASDGYLVFMPDIKYYEGNPGWNALDCITSSVQKVIDLGYADPDHIGLQGHSWGGYQSSFILTQSDLFACVVTGAPVTNLTSMYNILYKNSGTNNHGIFEKGQVRMGKSMFDDLDNYIAQSPVQNAAGISTPFMILHGTVDGAVDWNQGLEYYNAARRLGKEVILLSYPDENHHLANQNNQKDFQRRMKQFFDHYLKETPKPEWMQEGIPFLDKLYNKGK